MRMEKEMATHSSVLAWRIPRTEEPDGLLSMESHRVRHDWSDLAAAAAAAADLEKIEFLMKNQNQCFTLPYIDASTGVGNLYPVGT